MTEAMPDPTSAALDRVLGGNSLMRNFGITPRKILEWAAKGIIPKESLRQFKSLRQSNLTEIDATLAGEGRPVCVDDGETTPA